MRTPDVIIIGGGLAGLTSAIQLARQDLEIMVVEKKEYPFHRVCGEYISNEVRPFLERHGLFPAHLHPPYINKLLLTSTSGLESFIDLPLGGFGVSRYQFDYFLYKKAIQAGVRFITRKYVRSVAFQDDQFVLELNDQQWVKGTVVIGAFGKRSLVDKSLDRPFMKKKSPYLAVKYHLKGAFQENLIALHNFKGGYAGVSMVENKILNLCYLASRADLKKCGDIRELEKNVLMKNPHLEYIFNQSESLFDYPRVINEISFEPKGPVERHVLMCGDAAGMITPLCGNGMAMAIHSSSFLVPLILKYFNQPDYSRAKLEQDYSRLWDFHFKRRLWMGRRIQKLFGSHWASTLSVSLSRNSKPLARYLVKQTHGKVF